MNQFKEFVPQIRRSGGYSMPAEDHYAYSDAQALQYNSHAAEYYDEYGNPVPLDDSLGELPPPADGVWALQCCCSAYEPAKITCMEYDDYYDRLWVGQSNGRITSFIFDQDEASGMIHGDRYSSFLASKEPVVELIPQGQYTLSINRSCVKMHTDGGIPLMSIDAPQSIDAGNATFTCGAVVQRGPQGSTHCFTGTSHTYALLYDLQSMNPSPVLTYDVVAASCCCAVAPQHVVIAGQDGKLRLIDGRFRSEKVQHTLDAHSGSVHDVCVSPDGMTMVTCGAIGRPSGNSQYPSKPMPDPLVRIFDLRMNRQLSPLSMTTGSPITLRFLVPHNPAAAAANPYTARTRMLMGASNGLIQITDPSPNGDPSHTQILYAPFGDQRESLTSAATSSTGQLMCIGTSTGTIAQFAIGLGTPEEKNKVNTVSAELAVPPPVPPTPPLSLSADSPVIGTAYCIKQRPPDPATGYEEPLCSSFESTPRLRKRKLRLCSARKISSDLLRVISAVDFLGITPNPGFALNALLHAPPINGKRAYTISDPRKLENATGGAGGDGDASSRDATGGPAFPVNPLIPYHFRKHESHRGKFRINQFNYGQFNATPFAGLENSMPNAYTNAILQLLCVLPEIEQTAFEAQLSHFHHHTPTSLYIELGFIFHMMSLVLKEGGDKVVAAANFQRTLQQVPEAVALGLFDGSQTNPQLLVQTFTKFLFQHLHRESELEMRPLNEARSMRALGAQPSAIGKTYSAVDDVFGHAIVSQTTFLISNTTEVGSPIRAFSLDLVYPSPKAGSVRSKTAAPAGQAAESPTGSRLPKPSGVSASFASTMWHSLRKETSMRGWCNASSSYEPFKQVRSMVTLPSIMAIMCGDTVRDPKESTVSGALGEAQSYGSMRTLYWASANHLGGAWLPTEMEVAALVPAAGHPSRLVISVLLLPPPSSNTASEDSSGLCSHRWAIFDGQEDCIADAPASQLPHYNIAPSSSPSAASSPSSSNGGPPSNSGTGWNIASMRLCAVVSEIISSVQPSSAAPGASPRATSDLGAALGSMGSDTVDGAAAGTGVVGDKHIVLHLRNCVPASNSDAASRAAPPSEEWTLFNDFLVQPSNSIEAVTFPEWRHPCAVFFARSDYLYSFPTKVSPPLHASSSVSSTAQGYRTGSNLMSMQALQATLPSAQERSLPGSPSTATSSDKAVIAVPASVLQLPSLSTTPSIRLGSTGLPGPGTLIAFDGEFVSVALEKSVLSAQGSRVVAAEGRQVLARISLVDGGVPSSQIPLDQQPPPRVLVDDYILPNEAIVDYVTRFSGIVAEDLQPAVSRHAVVTNRTAYLKLRFFADRGCKFVGHGLQKDFETANIVVPSSQVIDTVELWRLPAQRKISLRFLAAYLLKVDIQDEIHDSIEDAKTALALYRHYETVRKQGAGAVNAVLQDVYAYGARTNWVIGSDKLR